MALQSALSHLRTSASIPSSAPAEREPENPAVSAVRHEPTTVSMSAASLFNLEDDAFNFSDNDFDPPISFGVMCKPASLSSGEDRLRSNARGNNMEARNQFSQNRTAAVTGRQMSSTIPPNLEAHTKPTVNLAHSVLSNSLDKLRSFTFVRTKSGRRKPEVGSIMMPPAKRTVCGDITTIRGSGPSCSQPPPCPPAPAVLNQATRELGTSSPSNIPPKPKQSLSAGISIPSHKKTDFDFDAFLSELGGNEDSTAVSMATQSTKHPHTCKPACNISRRVIATPTVTKSTPSTLSSCSIGTPTHATTTSNLSRTPLRLGQTPSNVEFRTPVMKSLRPNTVGLTSTPGTGAAASSSTVFTTPRAREASRRIATPSTATTPIFKTSSGSRLPVRRKFPGPAGLLPTLTPGQSMESITIPPPSTPVPASTPRLQRIPPPTPQDDTCPEPDEFSQGPWLEMLEDLDMSDASSSMLLQYSISSALKQASSRQLQGGKVVHLRVVLKSIAPAGKNASAVLKDPTGEVLCTVHTKVLDDHQGELQPGAVLILRQVSVFSPTPRKHYLNITPDNIVRIYSPNADAGPRQPLLLERECAESNTSHCPTMPSVTRCGEDSPSTGRMDDTRSESENRFDSVLKSCQSTLATFAQSSQLSQQRVTSHSNQHVLLPVLIENARTPSASGNQDDRKTQNTWNDNGGDSFEDWGDFECFDGDMHPEQLQSSDVGRAAGNAPQEQKESAFFNNLCEGIRPSSLVPRPKIGPRNEATVHPIRMQ